MKRNFLQVFSLIILSFFVFSCGEQGTTDKADDKAEDKTESLSEDSGEEAEASPAEEKPEAGTADLSTPEGFMKAFKEAYKNKDTEALKALCDSEETAEAFLQEGFFEYYTDGIDKLSADSFEESTNMPDAQEFTLVDDPEADTGSAVLFMLKKNDKGYQIVNTMGIG